MHVKKSKFVKITCILVFSDNDSFVRKCSICNCEINTLYTNDMYANEMYANERLPLFLVPQPRSPTASGPPGSNPSNPPLHVPDNRPNIHPIENSYSTHCVAIVAHGWFLRMRDTFGGSSNG